jgi:hypothetical protein
LIGAIARNGRDSAERFLTPSNLKLVVWYERVQGEAYHFLLLDQR